MRDNISKYGRISRLVAVTTTALVAIALAMATTGSKANADPVTYVWNNNGGGVPTVPSSWPIGDVNETNTGWGLSQGSEVTMVCWTSVSGSPQYQPNYATNKVFKIAEINDYSNQGWVNASFVYNQTDVPAC